MGMTMPLKHISYEFPRVPKSEMLVRSAGLKKQMRTRRSCRAFSPEGVPCELVENLVAVAHSAPSGANRQPWRFVAVDDPATKHEIRLAAEAEERESYEHRFPPDWLAALEPLGTNAEKPFLEIAPWLIVVFRIDWEGSDGQRVQNYYPAESVGIAAGMFLMACHQVGLATLTHTPNPMKFLREILGRPINEKPFLLIPIGYPAADCTVPDISKKPLESVLQWNRHLS